MNDRFPIRFELRLNLELVQRLDAWRAARADRPTRAAAVRMLLLHALEALTG